MVVKRFALVSPTLLNLRNGSWRVCASVAEREGADVLLPVSLVRRTSA